MTKLLIFGREVELPTDVAQKWVAMEIALAPFAVIGRAIPANWHGGFPLKAQVGGPLPARVSDYRAAAYAYELAGSPGRTAPDGE